MASPAAAHVHRRPPLSAARHVPVIEIDPPNDPRGTGQIDRAAARVLLEIQPRSGRERLAIPEGDLHVEQPQVPPRDDDADAPEPAFSRGQNHVVIEAEVPPPHAEVLPRRLELGADTGHERQGGEHHGQGPAEASKHGSLLAEDGAGRLESTCHHSCAPSPAPAPAPPSTLGLAPAALPPIESATPASVRTPARIPRT